MTYFSEYLLSFCAGFRLFCDTDRLASGAGASQLCTVSDPWDGPIRPVVENWSVANSNQSRETSLQIMYDFLVSKSITIFS